MLKGVAISLVLSFVLPIVASSYSDDPACGSKGYPALGIIQVTGGSADTTVYVDDRNYALGNGIWVYLEYNGIWTPKAAGVYFGDPAHADLQRGGFHCDPVPCEWDNADPCLDDASLLNGPDLQVF